MTIPTVSGEASAAIARRPARMRALRPFSEDLAAARGLQAANRVRRLPWKPLRPSEGLSPLRAVVPVESKALEGSGAPALTLPKSPAVPRAAQPSGGESGAGASLGARLVSALRSALGTAYERLNCYELVVKGLSALGIPYGGEGGLKERLVERAVEGGRPENACLTGEGITLEAGTPLFSRTFAPSKDPPRAAREACEAMLPALRAGGEGLLLSFSTRTRGHTGCVASFQGRPTFINSGSLDHDVRGQKRRKAVGEEDLLSEMENWFGMASRRGEPLSITLGRLDESRVAAFGKGAAPSLASGGTA